MPTKNYQEIYDNAQLKAPNSHIDKKIIEAFEKHNSEYGYFLTDDLSAYSEFICYVKFLHDVNAFASFEELCLRAYQSTVLFGGVESKLACATLQKIINDGFAIKANPIKDFFETIEIPKKAEHLHLPMWREHINGAHPKDANSA